MGRKRLLQGLAAVQLNEGVVSFVGLAGPVSAVGFAGAVVSIVRATASDGAPWLPAASIWRTLIE